MANDIQDEFTKDITANAITAEKQNTHRANVYNTVNDMVSDMSLSVGNNATTLGYYTINDGGKADYRIINSDTVASEGLIISSQNQQINPGNIIRLSNGLNAVLIVENSTINVLQVGAKSNGSYDNTSILQGLFDYCKIKKISIFFPDGNYYIANTIYLMENGSYWIYGNNKSSYLYNAGTESTKITCGGINCFSGYTDKAGYYSFSGKQSTYVMLNLSGIAFVSNNSYSSCFLHNIKLANGIIDNIAVHRFGFFLLGSTSQSCSIQNSQFTGLKKAFISPDDYGVTQLVDSLVKNNYINGDPTMSTYTRCFNVSDYANSMIEGNFVDFFKYVFGKGINNVIVVNNTFDYFYKFNNDKYYSGHDHFGMYNKANGNTTLAYTTISNAIINNNYFSHNSIDYLSKFKDNSSDTNMKTASNWCVLEGNSMSDTTISGNKCLSVANFLNVAFNNVPNGLKIYGNSLNGAIIEVEFNINWVPTSYKPTGFDIDALQDQQYTAMPTIDYASGKTSLTGRAGTYGAKKKFWNGQRIYLNKKHLTFFDNSFYDALGNVVTS